MRPDQVSRWLTDGRFQAFLDAANADHARAVALYNWNAEVSAAFMEILYHVEVLLRNAIDRQFPATTPGLIVTICRPEVWFADPTILLDETREKVNEAIGRLERRGKAPTRDRVVASLSFGFWAVLFNKPYEDLWRRTLVKAFPRGTGNKNEPGRLIAGLLHFRNRIAHHEAIFSGDLKKQHGKLIDLARLIDPEAADYIAALSRVEKLLLEKP